MKKYLLCDSIPEMQKLDDGCVDLIFTSMPDLSQTEFGKNVSAYQAWQKSVVSEFCRIIKDDGFICISQTDRKNDGVILTNHVTYINVMVEHGFVVKDEKIVVRNSVGRKDMYHLTYQYMTIFTRKGKFKRGGDFLVDIIVDPQEYCPPKTNQPCWSENFCTMVIDALTKEGDFVVDPFAAAGMVLYCADKMNREYLGCEIDSKMYNPDFGYFETRLPI